ncbi:MAG: hypothetical protein ACTSPS_06500 [Promethearchaeota archaeon]
MIDTEKHTHNHIKTIITLLEQFIEDKSVTLNKLEYRQVPKIYHYYNEIIRYWSKLNYIINKTFRSLESKVVKNNLELAKCLYSAYRMLWEDAKPEQILTEISLRNPQILEKLKTFSWDIALEDKPPLEKLSILFAMPSFLIQKLMRVISGDFLEQNLRALNDHKNKEIFTIHLSKDVKKLPENLKGGYKDQHFPSLYHIPLRYKSKVVTSLRQKSKEILILDKGSAAIVNILSPLPGEMILDMCSAPGIKSSLISQYTETNAPIIAEEFLTIRAEQMKNFIEKSVLKNLYLLNTDSIQPPLRDNILFDKILLDAPCTGSGTFLSNPELKWRQNEAFLHQNVILQKKLLNTALSRLKPNGILVYSTCSLYPEEGELQILEIINKVEPMKIPNWFSLSYQINGKTVPGTGRLFPSIHNTQGFFVGKFKKKEI